VSDSGDTACDRGDSFVPEPTLPLAGWESFYVIVGSSAGALTGLNFVVIALGNETRRIVSQQALRAYSTPTIVHFCQVLLVSAILSAPWRLLHGAAVCLTVTAVAGLVYSCLVTWHATRQKAYRPVLEDWVFHSVLPVAAYGAMLVSAILLPRDIGATLFVIAGASLLLLFIGIHNAWDAVVWMVLDRSSGTPASAGEMSSESGNGQASAPAAERQPARAEQGSTAG